MSIYVGNTKVAGSAGSKGDTGTNGANVITKSNTNGNINVDGTDIVIYDDTGVKDSIGNSVNFTLYADDSSIALWTDTLITNIPLSIQLGISDICIYSGTTAILLGSLDYLDFSLPNLRQVK